MLDRFYPAPPWRWSARRALWRYWVQDALVGATDLALHRVLRLLPTDRVSDIGARLGERGGRKRQVASDRARAALRRIRPEATPGEIEALLAAHWRHVGRTFAEFAAHHRILPEGRIAIEGEAHLRRVLAEGRPLIVAGTHVGSWETIPGALAALGIPFRAIFQLLPNRFRMRIALAMRDTSRSPFGEAAVPILPTLAAPFEAMRLLESRQAALLYYVDEHWDGRVQAPSLGRPIRAEGNIMRAVRLARRSGAAIIPAYGLRLGEAARFRVTFLPELDLGPARPGREGVLADIAALDAAIEKLVRAHPEQWFMLHAFRAET